MFFNVEILWLRGNIRDKLIQASLSCPGDMMTAASVLYGALTGH